MFYTRSSQYAIRAMRYLTAHASEGLCRLEQIATEEQVPQAFLAKLMQRLVKRRLVRSLKGMRGGFALNLLPEKITLFMIVDAIDDLSFQNPECAFGDRQCSEEASCPLHEKWRDLKDREVAFLQGISLRDLVEAQIRQKTGDLEDVKP